MLKLNHLPNVITLMRISLVAPFIHYLLTDNPHYALYIFAIAGLSDGLDGFLARRFNWSSWLGALLDPLADKCLMISGFIVLAYLGELPIWFCFLMILRDIIIMSGALFAYWLMPEMIFAPTRLSKLNTVLQILLIFLVLVKMSYTWILVNLLPWVFWATLATTLLSLIHYISVWGYLALKR